MSFERSMSPKKGMKMSSFDGFFLLSAKNKVDAQKTSIKANHNCNGEHARAQLAKFFVYLCATYLCRRALAQPRDLFSAITRTHREKSIPRIHAHTHTHIP